MSIDNTIPPFTDKQGQYLAFIHAYSCIMRRPPAEADFQRYFKVTPPTVHQMILTLEKNALIRRIPGQPRSIRLLVPPANLPPLLATSELAGLPTEHVKGFMCLEIPTE